MQPVGFADSAYGGLWSEKSVARAVVMLQHVKLTHHGRGVRHGGHLVRPQCDETLTGADTHLAGTCLFLRTTSLF